MGMLLVFLALAQTFVDSGLSAGLIQRKEISADDETSVFYLNVAAAIVLAGILWRDSHLWSSRFMASGYWFLCCARRRWAW